MREGGQGHQEALDDIVRIMSYELGVHFEDHNLPLAHGLINYCIDNDLNEVILSHVLIGWSTAYDENIPEEVIDICMKVSLTEIGEDNIRKILEGAKVKGSYSEEDIKAIARQLLEMKTEIVDTAGDLVPREAVVAIISSVMELSEATGLSLVQVLAGIETGLIKGRLLRRDQLKESEEELNELKSAVRTMVSMLNTDELTNVLDKTHKSLLEQGIHIPKDLMDTLLKEVLN